ncbi:MAG: response regulator [Chitinophagaceae bacterium]|nr:response regulator [Chitinophagaceae bacterium]
MQRNNDKLVMIADDDPDIVDVLQCIVEEEGYRVITTSNEATTEDVRKHMPDLLLLDRWMLNTNGLTICQILKGDSATRHIPILMLTASGDIHQLAKNAGADEFMEKPFDMNTLLQKIEELVWLFFFIEVIL